VKQWDQFWFKPRGPEHVSCVRIAIGILVTIQFLQYTFSAADWYGENGWFNRDAARFFIGDGVEGTGSIFRWSILFSYPGLATAIAIVGVIASASMVFGIGSRVSPFLAWIALGTFMHRAPFLTLVYEPWLSAMLAYLIIEPGRPKWTIYPGVSSGEPRLSANLAIQLMRCHVLLWVVFSLGSMLAEPVWWNGEAAWMLMKSGNGWIHIPSLSDSDESWKILGQILTHSVIGLQILVLVCLIVPNCRWLGRWPMVLFASSILLLLGDWMYAALVLATSLAVWPFFLSYLKEKNES